MVKITIEENGKIVNTMEGDIAVGFVASDAQDGIGGINNCIFLTGGMPVRKIITSLSFLCIEVVNAVSKKNKLVGAFHMQLFKKTLDAVESGKGYNVMQRHEEGGKE